MRREEERTGTDNLGEGMANREIMEVEERRMAGEEEEATLGARREGLWKRTLF